MRRRLAALLVLPVFVGVACKRDIKEEASTTAAAASDTKPNATKTTAAKADASVLEAIEQLGAEGFVVAVVRPSQWPALHTALSPWWKDWPELSKPLTEAKGAADLPGLLAYPLGLSSEAVTLDGWDPARPIVASLLEAPISGPPGAVATLPVREGWAPPMRHQVLVPATSAETLVASMSTVLERKSKPLTAVASKIKGARAFEITHGEVVLVPEADSVRLVIFQDGSGLVGAKRVDYINAHLSPSAAAPPHTAARHVVADPEAVAAFWIRSWRLRALLAWQGVDMMNQALRSASPEHRGLVLAKGMQLVLDGERMASDLGADADDAAFSVQAADGVVRLHAAVSLTPEGSTQMAAAAKNRGQAFVPNADNAWADLAVLADFGALADSANVPPAFERMESVGSGAELLRNSGPLGSLYIALRHPLGALGLARKMAERPDVLMPVTELPTALHVAWHGVSSAGPKGAVALQWPSGFSTNALSTLVDKLRGDSDFGSMRMDTGTRGGAPSVVIGMGLGHDVKPSSAFDPSASGTATGIVEGHADLDRIKRELGALDREVGVFAPPGVATMRMEQHGPALIGDLAWDPRGKAIALAAPAVDTEAKWESPIGASVKDEGAECLAEATRVASMIFGALTIAAPESVAELLAKAMAEFEAPLACASAQDSTREAATALARLVAQVGADVLADQNQDAAALALLERQCTATKDTEICTHRDKRAALPKPVPPAATLSEKCTDYARPRGDIDLWVAAASASLGGEALELSTLGAVLPGKVDAFMAEQRERVAADEYALPFDKPQPPSLGLRLDGTLSMKQIRPMLQMAAAAGINRVVISVRNEGGQLVDFVVPLLARTTPGYTMALLDGEELPPPDVKGGGLSGTLAKPSEAEHEWALLEVSAGTIKVRGSMHPTPLQLTPPTREAIAVAGEDAFEVFVYPSDSATWAETVAALVPRCPEAALVLAADVP